MKKIILLLIAFMQFSIANAQLKGKGQEEPSNGQVNANYGQYVEEGNVPMFPYTIFFKTKSDYYEKMKSTNDVDKLKDCMVSIVTFQQSLSQRTLLISLMS